MLSRGLLGVDCIVTTQAEAVSAHSKPILTVAQRDCRLRLKVQESVLIISFLHRDFIVTKCQVLASLCRSEEIHSPRAQFSSMSKTWKKPNQEQLNILRSDSEPNNYILLYYVGGCQIYILLEQRRTLRVPLQQFYDNTFHRQQFQHRHHHLDCLLSSEKCFISA